MSPQDRWAELLGRVEQPKKGKEKEKAAPAEQVNRLVADLLATADDRVFFLSKLTNPDELSRRRSLQAAAVAFVRVSVNTAGWISAERQNLLCHLTDLIRRSPTWPDRGALLWQATAAWCRSRDFRVQQAVGEEIRKRAGVQNPNLRAALREPDGWDELSKDEKVDVLAAVKDKWPTDLRMQAEEMITAMRALSTPPQPPRPAPTPAVIPTPVAAPALPPVEVKVSETVLGESLAPVVEPPPAAPMVEPAVNLIQSQSAEASPSEPPIVLQPPSDQPPPAEPTKPPKTKKKPEPPPEAAPLFEGFKTLVDSLNGLVRGPMTELIEQATKLQQSTADSLRAELDRLRAAIDAERELGGEERAEVARLKRELADARDRAATAERQLADAHGRLADTDERVRRAEVRAEQAMLDAERDKAEAVTSFRLPLTDRLRSQLADAADPEYAQQDGTDLEKVLRIRLRRVFEILRAADIDVTPTD